jgi:DNA-binding MarR family transcriptional regulator
MSVLPTLSFEMTLLVRDTCLCLGVQRASRAIGRMFDDAFRPLGLNNFQFSLLMMLNRPAPLTVGGLAECLAMDRTTTTANLKPLERHGLVTVRRAEKDARIKHVVLTSAGRTLLADAMSLWQTTNDTVKSRIDSTDLTALYSSLRTIAELGQMTAPVGHSGDQ